MTGQSYRGKVVMLYFGYTNCPDVCPATLANLADMLGKVNSQECAAAVRDGRSQSRHAGCAEPLCPRLLAADSTGLRGSDNELADVARRYRVAYSVDPKPPYTVMHSNAVFFFDPTDASGWSPPTQPTPPPWRKMCGAC